MVMETTKLMEMLLSKTIDKIFISSFKLPLDR